MVVHNGEYIYLSSKTAKPTERGKTFNDEFQFTFEVPTYVIDHMRYYNISYFHNFCILSLAVKYFLLWMED